MDALGRDVTETLVADAVHPTLPAWAMDAGADVCATSVHKMGSGA